MLDRGQLLVARTIASITRAATRFGFGVPAAVISSCDLAVAADRDVEGRAADVRDRQRRRAELADDAEVGRIAVLAEEVREVLPAAERRLVQADRDDHNLAGEGAQPAHGLGEARERALHVRTAAAVDPAVLDPRRLVRDRHRVEMAVEDDGRPGPVLAQPSDHDRRPRETLVEQPTSMPASSRRLP